MILVCKHPDISPLYIYRMLLTEKIMKEADSQLILAEIAKNEDVYNLADSKNDSFQLILTAIMNLETEEEVSDFVKKYLEGQSGGSKIRAEFKNVLGQTSQLMVYARLMTIPMLRDNKFITYTQLYNWRKTTNQVSLINPHRRQIF